MSIKQENYLTHKMILKIDRTDIMVTLQEYPEKVNNIANTTTLI